MTTLAFLCFIGVFVYALQTETNSHPPEGMRAPFADSSAKPILPGVDGSHKGELAIQNLSGREVGFRFSEIVAEALSFNKSNFVYNSGAMEKYFTPEGYKQYRTFLESSGLKSTLDQRDLQSGVIFEGNPLELASGSYSGVYKWVFEVPITLSFVPRDIESYRGNVQPQNRRFTLRAQFARVKDPQDPEAVRIEIWQVLPPRTK